MLHTANIDNIIGDTDSYKLNHWHQYPKDTEAVYSYFESRDGAAFPYTVFFGLQYLLKRYLVGSVVNWDDLPEMSKLSTAHFGNSGLYNYQGWQYIKEHLGGRLPLRIKAVAEGTVVPTGNVLMTVENTDSKCFWLTNYIETLLTRVWYPSTVATLSRYTVQDIIRPRLEATGGDLAGLPFMLHDFGSRGATSRESAGEGGMAHLINSFGTDTIVGMLYAREFYGAGLDDLGFSVPATEHSVMTAQGREGEASVVDQLISEYPTGILSVVADSYNIYEFVKRIGYHFREQILERDGVFVVRPDSTTLEHPFPSELVVWIAEQLWHDFGGTENAKGFKVLDPHVRILWGDGIDPQGITKILDRLSLAGFAAENMVFGMGGGLLQKVNRDTQRFAFKASAIKRNGEWHDVYKDPIDSTKKSKKGRLTLMNSGQFHTVPEIPNCPSDLLQTVFEDGKLVVDQNFSDIRRRAGHPAF